MRWIEDQTRGLLETVAVIWHVPLEHDCHGVLGFNAGEAIFVGYRPDVVISSPKGDFHARRLKRIRFTRIQEFALKPRVDRGGFLDRLFGSDPSTPATLRLLVASPRGIHGEDTFDFQAYRGGELQLEQFTDKLRIAWGQRFATGNRGSLRGYGIDELRSLSPTEFEELVTRLFHARGYNATHYGGPADSGIDIIVEKTGQKAIVQCKRYHSSGSVGAPVVRDLYGVMAHLGIARGYLVTTGKFTRQAREWRRGKDIELVDGFGLKRWLTEIPGGSSWVMKEETRPRLADVVPAGREGAVSAALPDTPKRSLTHGESLAPAEETREETEDWKRKLVEMSREVRETAPPVPVAPGVRIVNFPEDQPVGGLLYVHEVGEWIDEPWKGEELGEASGAVKIPAGKDLELRMQWTDGRFEALGALKANDLQLLSLGWARDEDLLHLRGLNGLLSLTIEYSWLTDTGLVCLRHLPRLRSLSLVCASVTDAGLAYLRHLPNLEHLALSEHGLLDEPSDSRFTDACLVHLRHVPNLHSLDIGDTSITDAGLATLRRTSRLSNLSLTWNTSISDAGLPSLRELTNLRKLDLRHTQLTDAGISELRQALAGCRIESSAAQSGARPVPVADEEGKDMPE